MHRVSWKLAVLVAAGAAVLSAGCQTSTCDRAEDGLTVTNAEGVHGDNTWFSAPYHDPNAPLKGAAYQDFPAARTITFEHGLGSVPVTPDILLAFSDHGSLAPGDGNEDIVECMDDQVIQIKNNTCSEFYIWIAVQGSGIHAPPCAIDVDGGLGGAPGANSVTPADAGAAGASH
jgi:hypothetical protein